MSYEELIASDIRLVILRLLAEDPDYSHNEEILHSALPLFGHKISRDRVRSELAWLAEQGLLKAENIRGLMVVKLTNRGEDVALGRASCPGVKRPRPEG